MENMGVISRVDKPTNWCSGMVVVPKSDGSVRICVDLTKLNESVLRENHPLPCVDQTLGQLTGAKIFSKIDSNSSFGKLRYPREVSHLQLSLLRLGDYSSSVCRSGFPPRPSSIRNVCLRLEGIEGVVCHMDDVLVHGKDQNLHDTGLEAFV